MQYYFHYNLVNKLPLIVDATVILLCFQTDPQNCDYALEAGATRNFEALRTAEKLAEQELKEKEEEEKNNPMKVCQPVSVDKKRTNLSA